MSDSNATHRCVGYWVGPVQDQAANDRERLGLTVQGMQTKLKELEAQVRRSFWWTSCIAGVVCVSVCECLCLCM